MEEERKEQIKEQILEYMSQDTYKPCPLNELADLISISSQDLNDFSETLKELESDEKIMKSKKNKYGLPDHFNIIIGRLQMNERGFGFVIQDTEKGKEPVSDLYISPDFMHGAMNNDRVYAHIMSKSRNDKRAEGEIYKIVKRANETIVGTFQTSKHFSYIIPDDKRVKGHILIPQDETLSAMVGHKVVVKITKWPGDAEHAEGSVIEILGDKDSPHVDILSIIRSYNLPEHFSEAVMQQVDKMSQTVNEKMMEGRRDLRDLRIVTIDGEDAKDLDDAISIEKTADGNYKLGVHIADVSGYVPENSPLDEEAFARGTSVYLLDRVIPMLPPELSNGVCSLNPGLDRLTFSVVMIINPSGDVVSHEIFESVIKTTQRMTYTDVYKILVEKDPEVCNKYAHLIDDFEIMQQLAIILREKREERGSLDFDFAEAKIILNEDGKPIDIIKIKSTIAEKIIEEFMILCNETISEHFYWLEAPFLYRIHEEPDKEKLLTFSKFVRLFNYRVKGSGDMHPKALQGLLEDIKGKKEERLISTMLLRSLQKARYSDRYAGHFGLASKYYSHFTAPIRRYPDLIVHRIMKQYLKGEMTKGKVEYYTKHLSEIARHCSERERTADSAEQAVDELKKVEYMEPFLGQTFDGIITGITGFGIFVELDNTIEGIVRLSSMFDDYYIFDEMGYFLKGERTGRQFRIGDTVKVLVAKTDLIARQIEFELISAAVKRKTGKKRLKRKK